MFVEKNKNFKYANQRHDWLRYKVTWKCLFYNLDRCNEYRTGMSNSVEETIMIDADYLILSDELKNVENITTNL